MPEEPHAIFVYGTLQRGGEREGCWPRAPLRIAPARLRGALYDLGPYPALLPGDDWVQGELWEIANDDWDVTLQVLDEVEGYARQSDDLYVRQLGSCVDEQEVARSAYVYLYADAAALTEAQRVQPDADGVCRWRSGR
jgi:gamma-glutamylcyclotransferase (GGCT)/AIG2-like uncharacterized protein YtfP